MTKIHTCLISLNALYITVYAQVSFVGKVNERLVHVPILQADICNQTNTCEEKVWALKAGHKNVLYTV